MKSLSFPEMFYKNSTKVIEDSEAIKNNLALMLQCEKNEQLGDPDFGVNLYKAKFSKNVSLAKELATDGILDSQKFCNNVLFSRDDVTVKKSEAGKIDVSINAIFSKAVNKRELVIIQGVSVDE